MRDLMLIDANSLIHRCFHALPPFTSAKGEPTGAIYGLGSVLLKIFRENKPDYIAAFFDRPEPTYREKIFAEYKIQRPKAPNELIFQIIESHNLFEAFNVKTFEIPGYEADDLIGTAATKFKNIPDVRIVILTGDLDDLQLVEDEKVVVDFPQKGISETVIYNEKKVIERYGVKPKELAEYKGFVGDASDNIPGVKGIGPKTAAGIISKYHSLENFFENGQEEKIYQKILPLKEVAYLSKKLAELQLDAPINVQDVEELKTGETNKEKIISYFRKFNLESLIKRTG